MCGAVVDLDVLGWGYCAVERARHVAGASAKRAMARQERQSILKSLDSWEQEF